MPRRNHSTSPWWRQFVLHICPRKTGSKSYITSFGNTATLLILRPEWVLSLLCSTEKPGQNCLKFHPLLTARWTRSQDEHAKLKMKINNTNLGQDIKSGDIVLIRNETGNKLTPAYNLKPHVVLKAKGTMISAAPCSDPLDKCVTRNASFFKKIRRQDDIQPQFSEVAEEEEITTTRRPESRCTTTRPTEESKELVRNGTVNSNVTRERPYTTRSCRVVRQPSAFKDFVLNWLL